MTQTPDGSYIRAGPFADRIATARKCMMALDAGISEPCPKDYRRIRTSQFYRTALPREASG